MVRECDDRREFCFAISKGCFGFVDSLDKFADLIEQGLCAVHRDGGKLIPMGIGILLIRVCLKPRRNEVIDEPRKEGLLAGGFCGIEIDAPIGGIGKGSEAFVDRVLGASLGASKALIAEAPGIAEALIATAIGLFAAIPAVVAYNRYTHDIDRLSIRFETFVDEFLNILQRQVR